MESSKLFVGNLPIHATTEELTQFLSPFGSLIECYVMKRPSPAGFLCAFVRFSTEDQSQMAQKACNGILNYPGSAQAMVMRPADEGRTAAKQQQQQLFSSTGFPAAAAAGMFGAGGGGGAPPPYMGAPPPAAALGGFQQQSAYLQMQQQQQQQSPPVWNEKGLKLFIGGLPTVVNESELRQMFEAHGTVTELVVLRNASTTGTRCGFVRFADPTEAQNAINNMNGQAMLAGSEQALVVRVADGGKNNAGGVPQQQGMMMPSVPSAPLPMMGQQQPPQQQHGHQQFPYQPGEVKLFVGNIPNSTTQDTLTTLFTPFGNLLEVFLFKRGNPTGSAKCAFVRYADMNSASNAISQLSGFSIGEGMSLVVGIAKDKKNQPADPYAAYNFAAASPGYSFPSTPYGNNSPMPMHGGNHSLGNYGYSPY